MVKTQIEGEKITKIKGDNSNFVTFFFFFKITTKLKSQIVTKLKNLNCDKTQKLKL